MTNKLSVNKLIDIFTNYEETYNDQVIQCEYEISVLENENDEEKKDRDYSKRMNYLWGSRKRNLYLARLHHEFASRLKEHVLPEDRQRTYSPSEMINLLNN